MQAWKEPQLDTWLAPEIHEVMRSKELTLRPFIGQSPQLKLRRYLVDWVLTISEKKFILEHQTVHLAIYLLDNFMDQYDIQDKTIYLVTLTCLLIAIKVEEDNQVPKISELNSCINNGFHLREFLQMELMLLKAFAFDLTIPTAAHFVCYYETRAVTLADLRRYTDDNGITVDDDTFTLLLEKARVNMRRHIDYFLETSLQSTAYRRLALSRVAAACVAASRHCIRLSPTWPPPLQTMSGSAWMDIEDCVQTLLVSYEADMLEEQKAKAMALEAKTYSAVLRSS